MTLITGEIAAVIWRECVEGLLAVSLLHAWLSMAGNHPSQLRYLWVGAAGGVALAIVFAGAIAEFSDLFEGDLQEYLQLGLVAMASILIVRTVTWMSRSISPGALDSLRRENRFIGISIAGIAFASVFREGFEAVLFTYGIISNYAESNTVAAMYGVFIGLLVSVGTFVTVQRCAKRFSWRSFFRISRVVMLCLAASLAMSALDRAIDLGIVSTWTGPLWDSGWLLDDGGAVGGTISMLTGYRARPELLPIIVYGAFWLYALYATSMSNNSKAS